MSFDFGRENILEAPASHYLPEKQSIDKTIWPPVAIIDFILEMIVVVF